jgi:CRP-like cAMP-binding protein
MKNLNEHPLHHFLDDTEIALIDQARQQQIYSPNSLIIAAGERKRDILCIDTGEVLVYILDSNGQMQEIATLYQGSLIGEMNFVMPTHRTACVKALNEVRISRYSYSELNRILSENHNLAAKIFAALNLQMTAKLLGLIR